MGREIDKTINSLASKKIKLAESNKQDVQSKNISLPNIQGTPQTAQDEFNTSSRLSIPEQEKMISAANSPAAQRDKPKQLLPKEIMDFEINTPGLEIIGAQDDYLENIEMRYLKEKVNVRLHKPNDKPEVRKISYKGFDIDFLFRFSGLRLDTLLESVNKSLEFINENNNLKDLIKTIKLEGGLDKGVIFSLNNGKEELTFFSTPEKVSEVNDIKSFLKDNLPRQPNDESLQIMSYGSKFWSREKT